jgi:YD repeat-containing protein
LKTIRDADGSLSETPADAVTQKAYDLDSRVISSADDNGNVTQYGYDPLNRVKIVTHADGTTRSSVYDVHHNVTQSTDANGTIVNAFFDLSNRVVSKVIVPGAGVAATTVNETFSYDGASHLTGGTSNGSVAHSFGARTTALATCSPRHRMACPPL